MNIGRKDLPFTQDQAQQLSAIVRAELNRTPPRLDPPEPTITHGVVEIYVALAGHALRLLDRLF